MTRMYQIRVTRDDGSPVFEDDPSIEEIVTVFSRLDLWRQMRAVKSWDDPGLQICKLKLGRI